MKRIPYLPEEEKLILKLYAEGRTSREIAEEVNKVFGKGKRRRSPVSIRVKLFDMKMKGYFKDSDKKREKNEETKHQFLAIDHLLDEIRQLRSKIDIYKSTEELIGDIIEKKNAKFWVSKTKVISVPTVFVPQKKEQVAILEISDVHVGKVIKPQNYPLPIEYNFNVFKKRLEKLRDSVFRCAEDQMRSIPIKRLIINCLGDIVEGENIYLGQQRDIEFSLLEQTQEAAFEFVTSFFYPMTKFFKKIDVCCIPGNHGRIGKRGEYFTVSNFDIIFYLFCKSALSHIPNIDFKISSIHSMLYRIPECPKFTHLLLHGDELRGYLTLPYYSLDRVHTHYVNILGMSVDYLHTAHWHEGAQIGTVRGERIMNGSFIEVVELATIKKVYIAQAKQIFLGFHRNFGKTWQYVIKLSDLPEIIWGKEMVATPIFKEKTFRIEEGTYGKGHYLPLHLESSGSKSESNLFSSEGRKKSK